MALQVTQNQIFGNKETILALLYEAGGEVIGKCRLRAGIYALRGLGLHDYDKFVQVFLNQGPAERRFDEDVEWLGVYVDYGSVELKGVNDSDGFTPGLLRTYTLDCLGISYGREYTNKIRQQNPQAHKKLREVASLLGKPVSEMSAKNFYRKYVDIPVNTP